MSSGCRLIEASGQGWKLTCAWVTLAFGGVATAIDLLGPPAVSVPASLAVIALGSMALLFLVQIRCPACRRSLGWWALRTQRIGRWQDGLASVERCPRCGHVEGASRPGKATGP